MRFAPILAATLTAAAMPAVAQVSDAECRLQADVVMEVVAARQSGTAAEAAVPAVSGDLSGEQAKYQPVVPALVEWVYGLPEDAMGPEVGDAWVTACAGQ